MAIVLLGLGLSATIGLGLSAIVIENKSYSKNVWLKRIGVALCTGFILTGLISLSTACEQDLWNEGYCDCGGQWELVDIEKGHRNGSTTYYYLCDECDKMLETHVHFK
jgi:hypothetical protein